jgi:hypothetical protein
MLYNIFSMITPSDRCTAHHVPREEALPHAKVGHGCGHTRHLRDVWLLEQAAQVAQVPAVGQLLIKQRHGRVSAIQRWVDGQAARKENNTTQVG